MWRAVAGVMADGGWEFASPAWIVAGGWCVYALGKAGSLIDDDVAHQPDSSDRPWQERERAPRLAHTRPRGVSYVRILGDWNDRWGSEKLSRSPRHPARVMTAAAAISRSGNDRRRQDRYSDLLHRSDAAAAVRLHVRVLTRPTTFRRHSSTPRRSSPTPTSVLRLARRATCSVW